MSPTLSFSSALLALLDSAVSLTSLSFSLTAKVPAFASSDVTSPVIRLVFAFSDFISVFFSVAGAAGVAGVAGVAGFACAKPRALKLNVVKATTKILIMFFTVSPPSFLLDVVFSECFKSFTEAIKILRRYAHLEWCGQHRGSPLELNSWALIHNSAGALNARRTAKKGVSLSLGGDVNVLFLFNGSAVLGDQGPQSSPAGVLAEKGGSRTLRGPYGPQTGFEDQRHHRAPSFSTFKKQLVNTYARSGKGRMCRDKCCGVAGSISSGVKIDDAMPLCFGKAFKVFNGTRVCCRFGGSASASFPSTV